MAATNKILQYFVLDRILQLLIFGFVHRILYFRKITKLWGLCRYFKLKYGMLDGLMMEKRRKIQCIYAIALYPSVSLLMAIFSFVFSTSKTFCDHFVKLTIFVIVKLTYFSVVKFSNDVLLKLQLLFNLYF